MPTGTIAEWLLRVVLVFCTIVAAADYEMKLVFVVFRHGQRAPLSQEDFELYPNDPYLNYTFYPEGYGGLTNTGKLTMYDLGNYLRDRYDDLLGDVYTPNITIMRTTDNDRTIMSAQLVNAGLWPPSKYQTWNDELLWMPIPLTFVPKDQDSLMISYECPSYIEEYERVFASDEVQTLIEPYHEFFSNLSLHTGLEITRPKQVFFIYHTLVSELNYNLTLPDWTSDYFPNGLLENITQLEYAIGTYNTHLNKVYGGPLIKEVLSGSLSFINGSISKDRRIMLYSGHESNIASLLKSLGLWYNHIPDFGAALMFELHHDNSTGKYAIQIVYYTGKSANKTTVLVLPDCTEMCPIDKLATILAEVTPEDVDELCESLTLEETLMEPVENVASAVICFLFPVYLWTISCFSIISSQVILH